MLLCSFYLNAQDDYVPEPVKEVGFSEASVSMQKPGLHEEFWDNGNPKRLERINKRLFRDGEYKEWYENGNLKIEETYNNGHRTGPSKRYFPNGQLSVDANYVIRSMGNGSFGSEERSLLSGKLIEYHENGLEKREYTYKDGIREGVYKEWYDNGQLARKGYVRDKYMVDKYEEWHPNGKPKKSGYYDKKELLNDGTNRSKKEGAWIQHYPNGQLLVKEVYENGFLVDGELTYYHENGEIHLQGTISEGLKHGPWNEFHENKALRSKIEYRFGRPMGQVAEFYPNGNKMTEGQYGERIKDVKQANKEGLWIDYYENGQKMREATFEDGRESGPSSEWYANGQKRFQTSYVYSGRRDAMYDGETVEWFENGDVKSRGSYQKGIKVGEWKTYYPNGNLKIEATYDGSQFTGTAIEYYANGNKKSVGGYRTGRVHRKNGAWKEWYEDGKLSFEGNFAMDKLQGECSWYNENGKISKQILYDLGVMVGYVNEWYPDGSKKIKGNYCDESHLRGLKCGPWQVWDEQGQLIKDEVYKKGRLK